MEQKSSIVLRDYPLTLWLIGLLFAGGAGYYYMVSGQNWALALSLVIVVLTILLPSVVTVQVDRYAGTLTIRWSSLLRRKTRQVPLRDIQNVQVQSSVSYDEDGKSVTYRVVFVLNNGEVLPLRSTYSSGYLAKEAKAHRLRELLGLESKNLFEQAQQQAEELFHEEQASTPGIPQSEQVTQSVHWRVETKAFGGTPITRWHSQDYTFPDGFLFLAQKFPGQKTATSGLMGALSKTLLQSSLKMYAFGAEEAPNAATATLLSPLPAGLEEHFTAFTTNASIARQVLNPWACNPLIQWTQRYPMKQGSQNQLVVLFGATGLYLSVLGLANPEFLEELTYLGVDLVRAQGSS